MVVNKCPVHPKYQVKRKPTGLCKVCWILWSQRSLN